MRVSVFNSRARAAGPLLGCLIAVCCWSTAASAQPYPFEGTWVRADRTCTPTTTRVRTYTAKEVGSSLGHCSIRRVSSGSGAFELLEECRRNERTQTVTETIRMTSPDSLTLKRQTSRLKITRSLRYARCTAAAPAQPRPTPPSHPATKPSTPHPVR